MSFDNSGHKFSALNTFHGVFSLPKCLLTGSLVNSIKDLSASSSSRNIKK